MASRKCMKCGKQQSFFGPGLLIQSYNGIDYCSECLEIVKEEIPILPNSGMNLQEAPLEQIQAITLTKIDAMLQESVKQTASLQSIQSTVTIFMILVIIGIVFQGCSSLMNF